MIGIDMPMPKTCSDCLLLYEYDSGFRYECPLLMEKESPWDNLQRNVKDTMHNKREDDCPLVEVPPAK